MDRDCRGYRIELIEDVADINCKVYMVHIHGDFFDCIIEQNGVFELVSNFYKEYEVFQRIVNLIKSKVFYTRFSEGRQHCAI